jgi:Tfp pilus assembly protein PilV
MRLPGVPRRLRGMDHASEGGWALIETMFAAALLVVISLAVMSSMDVASRTSAASKGRTVASSLAEQDQERMRAMTINQLSNYHGAADPVVGGVTYHVDSRSEWVQDTSGQVASCSDTGQASYVRISTTVTSAAVGRDTKPVVMRGIVAPPVGSLGANQGTLAVKVSDRNGDPVANLPVSLTGNVALSDTTNALGCAIFAYIPAGAGTSYTVRLNTTDWVNQNDDQLSEKYPNVTPGGVTVQPMTYDHKGSASVDFRDSTNQPPTPVPSWMMVVNSSWTPTPGARRVSPSVADGLFPFVSSPYNLYAGSCPSADPGSYGETAAAAAVLPSQNTGPVVVRVPTLNFSVVNSSNLPLLNATVSATATGAGCTDKFGPVTDADGSVSVDLPYGNYVICASSGGRKQTATVANTVGTGTTVATALKPSAGAFGSGACT